MPIKPQLIPSVLNKAKAQRRQELLREEQQASQRAAFWGRTVALILIGCLVTTLVPWPGPLYLYAVLGIFALLGWGAWRVEQSQHARSWHQYAFVTADFALLTFVLLYPNPMLPLDYPAQFIYRYGNFIFLFVILAGLTYEYRPRLVLWGGVSAILCWAIGLSIMLDLPNTVWRFSDDFSTEAIFEMFANPYYVDVSIRVQEMGVLLIVTLLLTLTVYRSRAIAIRQADLARERANLARYFPTQTAELLAGKTKLFSTPREFDAGIIFADLVSFTEWSQRHTPTETITLLREVQGMMSDIIFKHDGTLDKFIGDGLMATFGTPEPTAADANNALSAAIELAEAFERWGANSVSGDSKSLKLAVGAHYGRVVVGDIGSSDRLEFAVLGDAVNVASRLEANTRQVGCRCLLSEALIEAARIANPIAAEELMSRLHKLPDMALRGRSGKLGVYALH